MALNWNWNMNGSDSLEGFSQVLSSVNRCQIEELEQKGKELDPSVYGSGDVFAHYVRNVQAAIIHTYQITAFRSLKQEDPKAAAELWKSMSDFCNSALTVLKTLKVRYPGCGTNELYDLTLDYKIEADKRFHQNLEDSECAKMPVPDRLFPKAS
jgi:hypothetical protein